MKRYAVLFLTLVLAFAMTACAKPTEASPEAEKPAAAETPAEEKKPEPAVTEAPTEAPTEEPKPVWPETLIDLWILTDVEITGVQMRASDVGMDGSFDFRADGTVALMMGGEEQREPYEVSGNSITVFDVTGEIPGRYDPDTDSITFEQDDIKMMFVRKSGFAEAPTPEPVRTVAVSETEALGTWTFTECRKGSTLIPADMLGEDISMSFTFNENGTASMKRNGVMQEGMRWTVRDGKIAVSLLGVELYELAFDGTMLFFDEPNSGFAFCFSK